MHTNGWYAIGLVVTLLAGVWWTPHLFHETSRLFVRVLTAKVPGPDKLLECSNIEQFVTVPSDGKLLDTEAVVQGWRMFSSTGAPGRLHVQFKKSAGTYVFYPRLDGESDSISVYEVVGDQRRLLYFERGTANGWTPVARRMLFRADCVANGWSDEEFSVGLEIILEGPHAQLWHKNKVVFF